MNKTELKTYISMLESVAKGSKIATIKGFKVGGGTITATDLTTKVMLNYGTLNTGVVSKVGLERLVLDPQSDISAYKVAELDDYPTFVEQNFTIAKRLSEKFISELLRAADYVSKDNTREALEQVWLQDGAVVATDGYKAIRLPDNELEILEPVSFSKPALTLLKKAKKYGTWSLYLSEEVARLTNGYVFIEWQRCRYQFPDMVALLAGVPNFNYIITLPMTELTALSDKEHHVVKVEYDTGDISLGNIAYKSEHDFVPTGLKSEVALAEPNDFAGSFVPRIIVMPMNTDDNDKSVAIDLAHLKVIGKKGTMALYVNRGKLNFLQFKVLVN